MLNFKDFLFLTDLELIFEAVEDHQPLHGRWERPLATHSGSNSYRFNVSGDNCGDEANPCYKVNVNGNPAEGVTISFYRAGSTADAHKGVGLEVFKGVLKALSEYVTTHRPAKLGWSAVSKSVPNPVSGKIQNPEARAHVYEGWALRHLFPDKYVGMQGQWIRRDLYEKNYVSNGYPPVPEGVTGDSPASVKARALEAMKEQAAANREQIRLRELERERQEAEERRREEERRRQEAERRRQEEERRRAEMLANAIDDPAQNPNGIREGDTVYVVNPDPNNYWENHIGRVERMQLGGRYRYGDEDDDRLHAYVQFAEDDQDQDFRGRNEYILVTKLKKETPEAAAERERMRRERLAALINDPQQNPNGVQEGDQIVTFMRDNHQSAQSGLLGRLRRFEKSRWGNDLHAYIDWDDHAREVLGHRSTHAISNLQYLFKATPEEMERIRRERRGREIEDEVERRRELAQRRQRDLAQPEAADEETQALINHPDNPQRLKPGDYVTATGGWPWRNRGRKGVIVSMRKPYWGDGVEIYVRFHNSRAEPSRYRPSDLERDESPEAAAMQTRRQQQLARQQAIAASSGGRQIGDQVTIQSGRHRGKSGRILSFRRSGATVSAVVATMDGNVVVNINSLGAPPQPPGPTTPTTPTEWYRPLGFLEYCFRRNSVLTH